MGAYHINGTLDNFSDINLETLVGKGVIRKELDTPSTGYTTYTLLRDIIIDCSKNGWTDYLNNPTRTIESSDHHCSIFSAMALVEKFQYNI